MHFKILTMNNMIKNEKNYKKERSTCCIHLTTNKNKLKHSWLRTDKIDKVNKKIKKIITILKFQEIEQKIIIEHSNFHCFIYSSINIFSNLFLLSPYLDIFIFYWFQFNINIHLLMREQKLQTRNYYQQLTTQNFQKKQHYYTQTNFQTTNQNFQKQIRQIVKQPKYSINNLPIIYDNAKTATPKRSSRIVYASKQEYQRERTPQHNSYQGVKFNKGRQQFIKPLTPPKQPLQHEQPIRIQQNSPFSVKNPTHIGHNSNQITRKIVGNVVERGPEYMGHRVQATYQQELRMPPSRSEQPQKYMTHEQNQRQTSRILIQKNFSNMLPQNFNPQGLQVIHVSPQNLPPGFGQRPVASYITSQIELEPISGAQFELKSHNGLNRPQNVVYSQNQRVLGPAQYNSKSGLSTSSRQIPHAVLNQFNLQNAMQRQGLQQNNPQNINHRLMPGLLSSQTVPKIQFDKCITECKNWQTKYNELYLKYMSLVAAGMQSNSTQIQGLRQQNYRLKRQLKQQKQRNGQVIPILSQKFIQMVSNQKQATIRQCNLLLERYRLQAKHNKF